MTQFVKNVPVYQGDPQTPLEVMGDPPWTGGASRLQLIVVDDAGNQSDPVFVDISVKQRPQPTAKLALVDGDGNPITPVQVPFGASFTLSAAGSAAVAPANLVEYRFTLVKAP
jgi:hypothetical protein